MKHVTETDDIENAQNLKIQDLHERDIVYFTYTLFKQS
jgi:hypothetical protein